MEGSRWGGAGTPDLLTGLCQRVDQACHQHLASQGTAPQSRTSQQIAEDPHRTRKGGNEGLRHKAAIAASIEQGSLKKSGILLTRKFLLLL